VLVIGAGAMAREYVKALRALKVEDISVISSTEETAKRWRESGVKAFGGGYEKALAETEGGYDLVIVATPVGMLEAAAKEAIRRGNKNVLVEKPGALYSEVLEEWAGEIAADVRVRVGYNRLMYPGLWRLREAIAEGGERMTSCFYTFTEWVHTIDFNNNATECYERWGISNSLHVISMAHGLVGMPVEMSTVRRGGLGWHERGAQFAGAGVTDEGVVFSYHADWDSAGRWGVEVMTDKRAYRMIPLEKVFVCEKGSVEWKPVEFECAFGECKMGVAEELAVMLRPEMEGEIGLVTLEEAARYTRLAEDVFGYCYAGVRKGD
jgi:predicted dehydrogenase